VSKEAEAKLASAISAAETAMKDEAGAKDKILVGVESIKLANEIKKLFGFCREARGTVKSDRKAGLKGDLEKYTKDNASTEEKNA